MSLMDAINPYDVYGECWWPPQSKEYNGSYTTRYPQARFFENKLNAIKEKYGIPNGNSSEAPCIDMEYIEVYYNQPAVQKAFNVDTLQNPQPVYKGCNDTVKFMSFH